MEPAHIELQLGALALSLIALSQAHPTATGTQTIQAMNQHKLALEYGKESLKRGLEAASTEPGFGWQGLPDGSSWVKGLALLDWELAHWWVGRMKDRAWHKTQAGIFPCQELISDARLMAKDISEEQKAMRRQVLARSFSAGVPLTQVMANAWAREEWDDEKDCLAHDTMAMLTTLFGRRENNASSPVLGAYLKAGGAMAIKLKSMVATISNHPGQLDPLEAVAMGVDMRAHPVGIGKSGLWWESWIEDFVAPTSQRLIQTAQSQGLSTRLAYRRLVLKTGKELLLGRGSGIENGEKLRAYLDVLPEGLDTPTPSGRGLAWQHCVANELRVLKYLIQYPQGSFPLSRHTASEDIWTPYLRTGSFARLGARALTALVKIAPMTRREGAPPLLQACLKHELWDSSSSIVEMLNRMVKDNPSDWLGTLPEQLELAKRIVLKKEPHYAALIAIVPALMELGGTVAPELLLTAQTFHLKNHGGHAFQRNMPEHWPKPNRPIDRAWHDGAVAQVANNCTVDWFVAELGAFALVQDTVPSVAHGRVRL